MIYRILAGFFCFFSLATEAQVLRDLNYNYIYPNTSITFDWKVVKTGDHFKVFYEVRQNDAGQNPEPTVQLETRGSISEKSENSIPVPPAVNQSGTILGSVDFQVEPGQNIIVAKVTVTTSGKALVYLFHKQLPKNKSLYLLADQQVPLKPFTNTKKSITFSGFDQNKPVQVFYYKVSFPPAAPAFSSTLAKVSKGMKPDSVFTVGTEAIQLSKKGLYLAQQDTSAAAGLAFRVEEDYPKLNTIESLTGPLIYICTKQEAEKLKQVGNDKKKFDQLILTITGNSERARAFMRSYYRRVELANQYFSSYKEGWKTDRGMIYTIFGLPEEVYLFDDREVWEYKNSNVKIRFQFVRSPSLFDPDNYVLVRDKKFTTPWYEMIDLWRKARF